MWKRFERRTLSFWNMKRFKKTFFILLIVSCVSFIGLFTLILINRSLYEEEEKFYMKDFLLTYTSPLRPQICNWKSEVHRSERIVTGTSSVKYNGTAIRDMYVPGFDISPNVCPNKGCGTDLLVVVHTSYEHDNFRTAIRLTWKWMDYLPNVVVVFLLGRSNDTQFAKRVERESKIFGDLIVSRNLDTYDNLTLKSVAMAEWVSSNCHRAKFVLKTDDDVFINVVRLLQFIDKPAVHESSRTFFGAITHNSGPIRFNFSKYYISKEEYSSEVYPDYLQGASYMFTGDLSHDIFSEAIRQNFFRMEDVFMTGFLADVLQARRIHVKRFHNEYDIRWLSWPGHKMDRCDLVTRIVIHYVKYEHIFDMWNVLFGKTHDCIES